MRSIFDRWYLFLAVSLLLLAVLQPACTTEREGDPSRESRASGTSILRIRLENVADEPIGPAVVEIATRSPESHKCESRIVGKNIEVDVTALLAQRVIESGTVFYVWLLLPQHEQLRAVFQWGHLRHEHERERDMFEISMAPRKLATVRGRVMVKDYEIPARDSCVSIFRIDPTRRTEAAERYCASGLLDWVDEVRTNDVGDFEACVPYFGDEYLLAIHSPSHQPLFWRGPLVPQVIQDIGILEVGYEDEEHLSGRIFVGNDVLDHAVVRLEGSASVPDHVSIGTVRLDGEVYSVPSMGTKLVWRSAETKTDPDGCFFFGHVQRGDHRLRLLDGKSWCWGSGNLWSMGREIHTDLKSTCTQALESPTSRVEFRPNASQLDLTLDGVDGDFEVAVRGETGIWTHSCFAGPFHGLPGWHDPRILLVAADSRYDIEYTFANRAPISLQVNSPKRGETLRLSELASKASNELPFRRLRLKLPSRIEHPALSPSAYLINRSSGNDGPATRLSFRPDPTSETEFVTSLPPSVHGRFDVILSTVPDRSGLDFYFEAISVKGGEGVESESLDRFVVRLDGVTLAEEGETLLDAGDVSGGRAILTVLTIGGESVADATLSIERDGNLVFTDGWFDFGFPTRAFPSTRSAPSGLTATRLPLEAGHYVAEATHATDGRGRTEFTITPGADTNVTIILRKE